MKWLGSLISIKIVAALSIVALASCWGASVFAAVEIVVTGGNEEFLQAAPSALSGETSWFTVVKLTETPDEAMVELDGLRAGHPGLTFAVFPHLPGSAGRWAVVSAAYVDHDTAQSQLDVAKRLGIGTRPFIIRYTADRFGQRLGRLSAYPPSVAMSSYPDFIRSYPIDAADSAGGNRYLFLKVVADEREADAYAQSVRATFPGIHIAVMPPRAFPARSGPSIGSPIVPGVYYTDNLWRVAIATAVNDADLNAAIRLSNRLGLGDGIPPETLTAAIARDWLPADRSELERSAKVRKKLNDCLKAANGATYRELAECAGVIVTPAQMAQCLGADLNLDQNTVLPTIELARTGYDSCSWYSIGQDGLAALSDLELTFDTAIDIDLTIDPIPKLDFLANCKKSQTSTDALVSCVAPSLLSEEQKEVLDCLSAPSGEQPACLSDIVAQKVPDVAEKAKCLAEQGMGQQAVRNCLMDDEADKALDTAEACIRAAGSVSEKNSCLNVVVPAEVLGNARCLMDSHGRPLEAATCLLPDADASRVVRAIECARSASEGDLQDTLLRCSANLPPEATAALNCVAAAQDEDYLQCLDDPRLAKVKEVATCVTHADDVAGVIANCAPGIGDPKARAALACAVNAGGDSGELAKCAAAAILPGELGRLAGCAAASQGGPTATALCAWGPKMNAEWRIAAECAVSTGGNPVGTVACAGGRLTIRELTKCIGGEIGKDCFGPNNTIRKYYEGMINDLRKALGGEFNENNEIVKAVRVVETAIVDTVKDLGDRWRRSDLNPERVADNWHRSDLNPGNWKISCCSF